MLTNSYATRALDLAIVGGLSAILGLKMLWVWPVALFRLL